jgi:hypothetical protein
MLRESVMSIRVSFRVRYFRKQVEKFPLSPRARCCTTFTETSTDTQISSSRNIDAFRVSVVYLTTLSVLIR